MEKGPRKRRSRFRFQDPFPGNQANISIALNGNAASRVAEQVRNQSPLLQQPDLMNSPCHLPMNEDMQGSPERVDFEVQYAVDAGSDEEEEEFSEEPVEVDERESDAISLPADNSTAIEMLGTEDMDASSMISGDAQLKIESWRVLWGLLMTTGSQKLSKFQYQAMRMISDVFRRLRAGGSRSWGHSIANDEDLQLEKKAISCLPHYTTLSTKFKSVLFKSLAVRSIDSVENVDTSKAGARAKTFSANGTPQVQVRTVLPSEYAREDVANGAVFSLMKNTALTANGIADGQRAPSIAADECVDIWPIVAARELFFGLPRSISVDTYGWREGGRGCSYAEVGDVVEVCLLGLPDLSPGIRSEFSAAVNDEGYARLRGQITAIWTVHHTSRYGSGFQQAAFASDAEIRDRHIADILGFCSYISPSDAVTVEVPDVPVESEGEEEDEDFNVDPGARRKRKKPSPERVEAMRQRKEAIRARRAQMEQAWSQWEKPAIKPGDIVCLLRRSLTGAAESTARVEGSEGSRLAIAHRFWAENEERGRHVFWISGDVTIEACAPGQASETRSSSNPGHSELRDGRKPEELCSPVSFSPPVLYRDLSSCTLIVPHEGPRGPKKFQAISSMGRLESGEDYFIYRFLLFWDGFEVAKGTSASGEGFYMVSLNLPCQARGTSNAVRIISLCPPGVKSWTVFKHIQADIVKGMTEGFVDIDASGTRRRIFLDLVGCLGDTPALNASLDTLGHTANACCHLCKFTRRCTGLLGSRYTALEHTAFGSSSGRGYYQHLAVRDCKAGKESCRLLGIKHEPRWDELPLHSLREAMLAARPLIPKNSAGLPILSGFLDPYKSCFVAPDHLLTGHLRDCVNMAFKLLPSKVYRQSCESYMLGFLQDCELPVQNRLFDHEKKALYSMSMTELYALSVVAELGFEKGCEAIELSTGTRNRRAPHCLEAISIVGSASRLLVAFWRIPSRGKDSPSVLATFNYDNGMRRVSGIQKMVRDHILRLRDICSMNDEDVLELENSSCSRPRKAQLSKQRTKCLIARRCVDKPNVHRLLELAYSTLPMVGHVSRVGELSLEKAHQILKRAIQQSNNKDAHMQAMNSAIFNDWQARLTVLAGDALSGDARSILGCYRLLSGREAAAQIYGRAPDSYLMQVRRALGPSCCVPALLEAEQKSVFSPRAAVYRSMAFSWVLEGSLASYRVCEGPSEGSRSRVYTALQSSGLLDSVAPSACFDMADSVRATANNGIPLLSLTAGCAVEIVTYRPHQQSFHIPFVVHRRSVEQEMTGEREGPSMWAVVVFVRLQISKEDQEVWAALRPFYRSVSVPSEDGFDSRNRRFHMGTSMSFTKVDVHTLQKAAILHDCNPAICSPVPRRAQLSHGASSIVQSPGNFYLRGRANGYPPRRG